MVIRYNIINILLFASITLPNAINLFYSNVAYTLSGGASLLACMLESTSF